MKASCYDPAPGEAPEEGRGSSRLTAFHWMRAHRRLLVGGAAVVVGAAVLHAQLTLSLVVGESMSPSLETGDLLVIDKRAYCRIPPARGDIVTVWWRGDLMVKRVVGLPGEEVEISNGELYVNGALSPETHLMKPGPLSVGKGKLFAGKLAVLGDNRALPSAQMVHAVVAREEIVGKVVLIIRAWRRLSGMSN